uniref:Nitrogenase component 1 type Oxidoreductase n=1 Tax=Candidatus Kentrum sp. FW TaxID=2126338 RepID=A0A450RU38_9GAMM|nr:MAG: Nitrogenase component 1 type Oxidoreductase [Candidatus Kentron sp. FW]
MAPTIAIETPGFSEDMAAGFQRALQGAIETLAPPERPARPRTINLLGLSIYHQHWQGSLAHLTELLRLMGIEVLAAPGAGSSVAEIERIAEAEYKAISVKEHTGLLVLLPSFCVAMTVT